MLSCAVVGLDLSLNLADTTACVISCSNVCVFKPSAEFKLIVFVLGSNTPAESKSSTISSFVVPMLLASTFANALTRVLWLVIDSPLSAASRLPAANISTTTGCIGVSKFDTESKGNFFNADFSLIRSIFLLSCASVISPASNLALSFSMLMLLSFIITWSSLVFRLFI